jgi:hypothetical protein
VGPVEDVGIERAVHSGPSERLTHDPVVGEVEHPADVQEHRFDHASECLHA